METIRVDKTNVVRRQIDAAIRMTFADDDAVAIHTIAAAAFRIVRDICETRGDIESYAHFKDWIAPGHEKQFWKTVNRSANFFKHADEDTTAIHEMNPEETDFVILFAAKWYRDLGSSTTQEMNVFAWWLALYYPKILIQDVITDMTSAGVTADLYEASDLMNRLPRRDRLKIGETMLRTRLRAADPPSSDPR